MVTVNWGP